MSVRVLIDSMMTVMSARARYPPRVCYIIDVQQNGYGALATGIQPLIYVN